MLHRSLLFHQFSTTSSSTSRTLSTARQDLKKHLRRLYQRIHPDRLGQHPKERLVNESSFKQLQSALDPHLKPNNPTDSLHQHHSHTSASNAPRQLTFFANHHDGSQGLIKTRITFHESRLAAALLDLFKALSIDPPSHSTLTTVFPSATGSSSSSSPSWSSGASLRKNHLRDLVDRARRLRNPFARASSHARSSPSNRSSGNASREDGSSPSPDEATLLMHALQRRHGIAIRLDSYLPVQPLILLRRLAGILAYLDEYGDSIRPAVVRLQASKLSGRIAYPFSVKDNDTIIAPIVGLGAMAADSDWRAALDCNELSLACATARARAQQLHVVQVLAARELGVRLVLCEVDAHAVQTREDLELLRDYEALIRDVTSHKGKGVSTANRARSGSIEIKRLAVMITSGKELEADAEQGVLKIGVERGINGVRRAIGGAGKAAREFEAACKRKEEEEKLTESVRRELRLERLRRIEGLDDSQWSKAISKLRRNSGALREILAGVSLAVGLETRVLRGGEVELAYDFEVEEI